MEHIEKYSYHLNLDERVLIEKMLGEGLSFHKIADRLGRQYAGIRCEVQKNGGKALYKARDAQEMALLTRSTGRPVARHGLTEEQRKTVGKMLTDKQSIAYICRNTGISRYLVRRYLKQNHPEYKERSYQHLSDRVSVLEQQCEILFELIKGKNGV